MVETRTRKHVIAELEERESHLRVTLETAPDNEKAELVADLNRVGKMLEYERDLAQEVRTGKSVSTEYADTLLGQRSESHS